MILIYFSSNSDSLSIKASVGPGQISPSSNPGASDDLDLMALVNPYSPLASQDGPHRTPGGPLSPPAPSNVTFPQIPIALPSHPLPLNSFPDHYRQMTHNDQPRPSDIPPNTVAPSTSSTAMLHSALTRPRPSPALPNSSSGSQVDSDVSCKKCGQELSSKCLMKMCQKPERPKASETACDRCGRELSAKCLLAKCVD